MNSHEILFVRGKVDRPAIAQESTAIIDVKENMKGVSNTSTNHPSDSC